MQLLTENPYASPVALDSQAIQISTKASLRRGLYYAGLWGLVVLPVPAIWLLMLWLLRPDMPPPRLPDGSLESFLRALSGMAMLPAYFGLIAIANYTSIRQYRYLVTFSYFTLFLFGTGMMLQMLTDAYGGPLYPRRRGMTLTGSQNAWEFACVATPMLLFAIGLTCWRIESDRYTEAAGPNHAH